MKIKRIVSLISIVVLCGGCIYSVELTPPYERFDWTPPAPLELSISLGEISSCFMQKCVERTRGELANIDTIFVEKLEEEHLFQSVLPHGNETDLYIEVLHYPDLASDISRKRSLYRDFLNWTLLGYVTPLPYPFYIEAEGAILIKTRIDGVLYTVKEYTVQFENTIWAASIVGARFMRRRIQEEIVIYLAPLVIDKMKEDYAFYKDFEKLRARNDVEAIKRLVLPADKSLQ